MIRKTYFIILILLAPISFMGCSSSEPSQRQGGQRSINVEGFEAYLQDFAFNIRATGQLLSYEEVEIRTPIAGNVLNIHFGEGQQVQKGTLLVEIDSRIWQAQKKGLEAQLVSASNELNRREKLFEIEGISQESVDQSRAQVSDLEARIDELAVRIDLAHIKAPFSGRLGMRDFSTGAFLSQGDRITHLVQTQRLRIDFQIPSRHAALAREGMEVKVVPSGSQDSLTARIYAINPMINTTTRSLTLRGEVQNPQGSLIPGDFAQVFLELDQSGKMILIPTDAIINELNAQVVYVAKNGVARRTEVEIGGSTSGRVSILSGLQPGDTVLLTGLMGVRNGSEVQVTKLNQEAGL